MPLVPSPYHNPAAELPPITSYIYLTRLYAGLRFAPRLALHSHGELIKRVCRYASQSPSACFTQLQSTVYLCRASPSWNNAPRVRRKLAPRTFPAQCRIVSDRSSAILFSPIHRHRLSDVPGFCILPVPLCSPPTSKTSNIQRTTLISLTMPSSDPRALTARRRIVSHNPSATFSAPSESSSSPHRHAAMQYAMDQMYQFYSHAGSGAALVLAGSAK
jgi:hypothetical protein